MSQGRHAQSSPPARIVGAAGQDDVEADRCKPCEEVDDLLSSRNEPSKFEAAAESSHSLWARCVQWSFYPGKRTVQVKLAPGQESMPEGLLQLMSNWPFWAFTAVWVSAALGTWIISGDTLLGRLTGGVVESVPLAKDHHMGLSIQGHIIGGSLLWFLGFVQVMGKWMRRDPRYAGWHRLSGRVFLLLFAFVVGPSAFHLSLFVGVGKEGMHLVMTFFSVLGMDTTVLAYYFFWRALQLARTRPSGDALQLHGTAMHLGLALTMLIVFQRPLQVLVICFRQLCLWVLAPWAGEGSLIDVWSKSYFGHNAILSWTTVLGGAGVLPFLVDGPHSGISCFLIGAKTEEQRSTFLGTSEPRPHVLLFWRLRFPLYLALRCAVTAGWTTDPSEAWPGPALGLNSDLNI